MNPSESNPRKRRIKPSTKPTAGSTGEEGRGDAVDSTFQQFERALARGVPEKQRYTLRLFVTGSTAQSTEAILNIRSICDEYLEGRVDLEVIDIYQQPERAKESQILASPTLIRLLPLPLRRIVGDLSDKARVLHGLEIKPHA